jgi:RhtB (resistance to homoserine/threonine) family protein
MGDPLSEFLAIAVMHAFAVVSPGPDFAIVLRQSLRHGRATALWTSVGIGCGLSVHILISMLGLGLYLQHHATALRLVQYAGAGYLAWIGWQGLRARPRTDRVDDSSGVATPTGAGAWRTGLLVNLLNPKAALFFIAVFSLAIGAGTPLWVRVGYGAWMILSTIGWFAFVSVAFTRRDVRQAFLRQGHWIDRALGVVFLGFAVSLLCLT